MSPQIVPFVDPALGNSSYLVELPDNRALVVDPRRDRVPYLRETERRGWDVVAVVETHLHADFISGGRELQTTGATLYAPVGSGLAFDHHPVEPGGEVLLGGLTLTGIPTPGHTPEHLSYLLTDEDRPLALFTGGSLLVGAVARTDLISPEETEGLTREMFRSLRTGFAGLPDELVVYPTHGAGSFCTAGTNNERVTTLGAEREQNPYLRAGDENQFVNLLLSSLGSYPTYFRYLRERNRQGPWTYGDEPPTLAPIAASDLDRLRGEGAVVVDVRPVEAWASGHVPGSLSIALRDAFSSWLGWLVDIDAPIVFVADPDQDRTLLVKSCLDIGYENLVGELDGGVEAWANADLPVVSTPRVEIGQHPDHLIDVRQTSEWQAGHIPGAVHAELGTVGEGDLPDGALAVHCGRGERAATAASVLEQAGRSEITLVMGGPDDWAQGSGRNLETG